MEILTDGDQNCGIRTIKVIASGERPLLDHREYERLSVAFARAATDDETKVVLLKGIGGCFCRGGDISEFLETQNRRKLVQAVTALFRNLATFPKPVVAGVEGAAIGVGCSILFHCDVVVASVGSEFRVPFVDYGLVPDAATSILAPRRMGYGEAFRFFCLGETLDARSAGRLGLVSTVAEEGESEALAAEIAWKLARKPTAALNQTRALLRGDPHDLCLRIDEEIELFCRALDQNATQKRLRRIVRLASA